VGLLDALSWWLAVLLSRSTVTGPVERASEASWDGVFVSSDRLLTSPN
jgi:hypothetical protein